MKTRFNLIWIVLSVLSLLIITETIAQPIEVAIAIKSEHKQLFNERGMFKQIADDIYYAKLENFSNSLTETFRKGMKSSNNNTYSENIKLGTNTSIELNQNGNRIFISYIIPSNKLDFKMTTDDLLLGIGLDRKLDPEFIIYYDVRADMELIQNGKAESIRLNNPVWTVKEKKIYISEDGVADITANDIKSSFFSVGETEYYLPNSYLALNDIQESLSEYIQSKVINNPDLLKEFEIDENRELKVLADLDNSTLIFQHNYSPKGMVTRSATKDANVIKEGPKSNISTVPVSSSPSGANKKPSILSSPKGTIKTSPKRIE